jgi:PAS domain S-box-containing protein
VLTALARKSRDWRQKRMASVTRNGALISMLGVAAGNILIPASGSQIPAVGTLLTVLGSWWIWRGISNFRLLNIRSDHTLTEVMDKMMDMLFLLDHQARILEANPECQQVTGCMTAELRGQPLARFVLEKKLLASHLDTCVKKRVHSRRFACHLHGADPVPVELYLSPIYNTADRPDGYVVVAHDMRGTLDLQLQIKERKRAETRLKKTMQALESERNILRTKQELINAELALARAIQQQLLPVRIQDETIGVFFRPLEELGGDFFDLLEMEDSLGIFMSDVSGHGVPAALISAMVKSILLQSRSSWADPAALLGAVNHTLCGQTGGNYVTALYGVYDRKRNTFRYANAGHPSPWRIPAGNTPVRQFADKARGVPARDLGQRGDQPARQGMAEHGTGARTGRKTLFFYTDGLVEAEKNGSSFGEDHLPQLLARHCASSAADLVLALSRARFRFRADSDSEDDICMICISCG